MGRESISLKTERTNPKFSPNIDLAVCASFGWLGCDGQSWDAPIRIQNGSTRGLACNWVVKNWRKIFSVLEGSVQGRNWDNSPGRFNA